MSLNAEMDALMTRLLEFQGKSKETTKKLLEMDENVEFIVDRQKTLKNSLKSLKTEKCDEEELNATLHFEMEQLHEREKVAMLKFDEAVAAAANSLKTMQEEVEKEREITKIENEAVDREIEGLKQRTLNLS